MLILVNILSFCHMNFNKVLKPLNKRAKFFYNDIYQVVLPPTHRFPMGKYKLVREGLQNHFSNDERIVFNVSPLANINEIASTHCINYIERYLSGDLTPLEIRRIGFPISESGKERTRSTVGGTLAAMHAVCSNEYLYAGQLAGGTHHAFYNYGEGFCIFSDIAVAANVALKEYPYIKNILIIDLDVHQGNGNAVLFENNDKVFTFSMHCKENYFSAKQRSNIDIEVDAGADDTTYLNLLEYWLPWLMKNISPDLVFYQAGVDVLGCDRLGKLNLSRKGASLRNRMVYEAVAQSNAKLVITMGGGYFISQLI